MLFGARHLINDEPVAVLLADDLILGSCCMAEMVTAYKGGNMVAVMDVPKSDTGSYGIVTPGNDNGQLLIYQLWLKSRSHLMPRQPLVLLVATSSNRASLPNLPIRIEGQAMKYS